jgi:hypothetical protein
MQALVAVGQRVRDARARHGHADMWAGNDAHAALVRGRGILALVAQGRIGY